MPDNASEKNRQRNRARRLRAARKRASDLVASARAERDDALAELEGARRGASVPAGAPTFEPAPPERLVGMTPEQVRLLRGVEDQRATVLAMLYRERESRKKAEMEAVRSRSAEEAATAALKASGGSVGALSDDGMAAIDALKEEATRAKTAADAAARDAAAARSDCEHRVQQASDLLARSRDEAERARSDLERERRRCAAQVEEARAAVARAEEARAAAVAERDRARGELEEAGERIRALEAQAARLSADAAASIDPERAADLTDRVIKTQNDALTARTQLAAARSEAEELRRRLSSAAAGLDAERRARSNAEGRLRSSLPIPAGVAFGKTMTVFRGTGLVDIRIDRIEFTASGAVEVSDASGVRGSAGRWRA